MSAAQKIEEMNDQTSGLTIVEQPQRHLRSRIDRPRPLLLPRRIQETLIQQPVDRPRIRLLRSSQIGRKCLRVLREVPSRAAGGAGIDVDGG